MKNHLTTTILFLLGTFYATAQDLSISEQAESFWDDVSDAAPYILAAIFLVSALANVGKLSGENRDYMGFFRGIALWAVSVGLIVALVTYILSLNF